MIDRGVPAICKSCAKSAPATDFRIDLDLKMMVCPACIKAKSQGKKPTLQNVPVESNKPRDWDDIDEQLAKKASQKIMPMRTTVQEIGATGKAKYNCVKCKFGFTVNFLAKTPRVCPYCNAEVPDLHVSRSAVKEI